MRSIELVKTKAPALAARSPVGDSPGQAGRTRYIPAWSVAVKAVPMSLQSPPLAHPQGAIAVPYVAEFVLLIFGLMTLGVFDPQFNVASFDQKTLSAQISEGEPNPLNQVRWLALAALASLAMFNAPSRVRQLAVAWWPALLLIGYCFSSALWSAHPEITLRRSFGILVPAYVLLVAIALIDRPQKAVVVIYIAFWSALLLNISVLPLQSSYDEFGHFRGTTTHKNILGSIGALAILCGVALWPWLERRWSRLLCLLYVLVWAVIVIISVSKTSLVLTLLVPLAFIGLRLASSLFGVPLVAAGFLGGTLAGLSLLVIYSCTERTPFDMVQLVWPDATFTGRTAFWTFMLQSIGDKWLAGSGLGAFWNVGATSPNLHSIHDYVRFANQAHNGYLDLVAALGLIGLMLLLLLFLHFGYASERLRVGDLRLYRFAWFFVLFSLFHNAMESSFLVPFSHVWHLAIFAVCLAVRFAHRNSLFLSIASRSAPWPAR